MTFDGFDAAVLIEATPALAIPLAADAIEEPTLQDALAESGSPALQANGLAALRPLSRDDLLLIAGGNGSEFSVWGPDPEPDPWDWWDDDGPNYDYDPGYWGNGGGSGGDPEPEANPTPCVEASPAGVSVQAINNAALAASNAIAAGDDEHFEYSSIIWSLNGTVGSTTPFTNGLSGQVNWFGGLSEVPAGATIVGIVHNHPHFNPSIDDRIPSGNLYPGDDWPHYNQVTDQSHPPNFGRGITADANLLLYIYTNQDHKTHVYDNTDKNQITPGCALQP